MLLFLAIALAEDIQIDRVVVYPSQAEVTRVQSVTLQPGVNEVMFTDLPPTVLENSVTAAGTGKARILGLDIRSVELEEDRRARVAELEARIQEVADDLRVAVDDQAAAKVEAEFLEQLKSAAAEQLSAELLFAEQTPEKARGLADLLRRRIPEVQERTRKAAITERELRVTLSALKRELQTVRRGGQFSKRDVVVQVEADTAGDSVLELSYALPGASWEPWWDVRYETGADTASLAMSARIHQTTGEDWTDVSLSLSTARPSVSLSPPTVQPFYLEPWQDTTTGWGLDDEISGDDGFSLDEELEEEEPMIELKREKKPLPMLEVVQAAVTERVVATSFDVPGENTVPGDGTRRKLSVTTVELPVELGHVAVPRLQEAAWLVANGTWDESWPLLGGEAAVFVDGAFVGHQSIPQTGTGGDVELALGQDEAVRVETELLEELTSLPDWMGKVNQTMSWRYTVENGHKEPISLVVRDRVPRSKDSRYRVKWLGDEPTTEDADGVIVYERTVAPGADTVVSVGYRLRYPKNDPPMEVR